MREFPELYILRHGETEWNAEGRVQGALVSPLTARGREQAARQGEILCREGVGAESHAFFVSPQGRAVQTAGIALAGIGARAVIDARLREISLGAFDGLTRAEIAARFPAAFAETDPFLWYDTAPGGEGFAALTARVRAFLDDLTRPAVVIAHGMTSRFLRGAALGLDLGGMGALPGGQGVVYRLRAGRHEVLT